MYLYRDDCIAGVLYRYRATLAKDPFTGDTYITPYVFEKVNGCCSCGGSSGSGTGTGTVTGSSSGVEYVTVPGCDAPIRTLLYFSFGGVLAAMGSVPITYSYDSGRPYPHSWFGSSSACGTLTNIDFHATGDPDPSLAWDYSLTGGVQSDGGQFPAICEPFISTGSRSDFGGTGTCISGLWTFNITE